MTVCWGIAGTGGIAAEFARALSRVDGGELVAVASRTEQRARAFAEQAGARRAHGSLAGLLADEEVDVVYVASPQSEHAMQAIAALQAGKHVLVEKPFTLDGAQAARVVAAAEASGRFLMEAMWSRFLPAYVRLKELVDGGGIGTVRSVQASLGFPASALPGTRLLDLSLGGGALLDIGVYPIHLATWLLGPPDDVVAVAAMGPTGVDLDTVVSMGWRGGAVATAQASISAWLPMTGVVVGTEGWVELPAPHHVPDRVVVHRHGPPGQPPDRAVEEHPVGADGLRHEIAHVQECIGRELRQSPVMTWAESLSMMAVLDRARAQIGLVFPAV